MANDKLVCPHCGATRKKTQNRCAYCGSELEVEKPSIEEKTEEFMENVIDNFATPVIKHGPRIAGIAIGIILIVVGVFAILLGIKLDIFSDTQFGTLIKVIPITVGGIFVIVGLSLLISAMVYRKK